MTNSRTKRVARRAIDRVGRDVTLRNFTTSTSGGRESVSETNNSPHTITARIERATSASPDRGIRETGEPQADATVYIADDASGTSSLRDGGGEAASEIGADGETYIVIQSDGQDNGVLALECERQS